MVKAMDEVQRSEHIFWDLAKGGPVNFQEFFSRNSSTGIQGDPTLATITPNDPLTTTGATLCCRGAVPT